MSDTSSQQPRPKIEVVRLPSNEQAKLKPLIEGGVQLEAQFQHLRYGDYASCGSLEEKPCYRFRHHEYGNKPPLATKSCDNIFARQLAYGEQGQGSPFMWRDATRSEEHLCRTSHSLPRGTSYRVHATSRIAVARSRITALLKKLSPRPRHKDSHSNSPCPCPWVVVEFSNPDLDSPDATGGSSSIASDHSFDLAVHAIKMRQEQAAKSQDELQDKPSSAIIPQVSISASSSHSSQPSLASSRATPKKGEGMRYRSAAPTKLRSAYNMGTRQVSGGTAAAKVKAKVAATSRPHTLRIQQASSPTHHSHLNAHHRDSSMASDESIGTCSLDADVTASETSECVDAGTISARTLQSLPLSLRTPEVDSIETNKTSGEAVTPEYVKRTARLFETSPDGTPNPVGSQSPDSSVPKSGGKTLTTSNIPSAILVNGTNGSKSDDILNGDSSAGKKPSYLGLACSISGYSGITKYDSKLREGFRSRDHSPGRIGLIKSRDVSPLRPSSIIEAGDGRVTYKSDCGNFLVAPTSKETVHCVNGDTKLDSKRTMEEKSFTDVHPAVNGISNKMGRTTLDGDEKPWGTSHAGDGYGMTSKQEFFSKSSSAIRESTRNFMSSMLETDSSYSSTHYESSVVHKVMQSRDTTDFKDSQPSSVPQEGLGYYSPVATFSPESPKTVPKESPGSRKTMSPRDSSGLSSPLKHSPESPKTSSKDSLSAPVTSPLKRSPGAVRVVEFTSQAKSYVRTAFVSSGSVESTTVTTQGYSESPGARAHGDGTQLKTYLHASSTSSLVETSDNATPSSKSFIQQRVERLYGPGALAQGFFKRTRHKATEEHEGSPNSNASSMASPRINSSPSLPVLRHLRPEFRAQLSLNPAVKKVLETKEDQPVKEAENEEAAERLSLDTVPALQQQVSVESVAESITDLQPAAPEVVLPIEQSQAVVAQPSETLEVTESETQEKDGHYFLKLLKQEIERLNGLVEEVEADLASDKGLPEEALGKLRAASGQARLLIRQKLQQFEGLCHKNIAQSSEEPFPTTSEDLAGFWDMVMLQVEHVNRLFEEIAKLRAANWIESKDTSKATKKRVLKRPASAPVKTSASSEAARKAREEGRRKMMEERRKAMREKRDAASSSSQVEIFVPQENDYITMHLAVLSNIVTTAGIHN